MAVVDDGYEHSLSIWDWQNRKKITETKVHFSSAFMTLLYTFCESTFFQSGNDQVFACEFHPIDKSLLVTCGKSQILFWTFNGDILQKKLGVFEVL